MGAVEDFTSKVRDAAQRLAQQGIGLYIVDSKGIVLPTQATAESKAAPLPRSFGRFEPQANAEAFTSDPRPAMELMAAATGGRYFHDTNDLTTGFKQTAITP